MLDPDPESMNPDPKLWLYENFLDFFFMFIIQHYFICRPLYSTVSEDAGIEPRAVAT
jgi:hypothetical protein